MRIEPLRVAVLIGGLLAGPRVAGALVLGGGLTDADCRVVFDGVTATAGASGVVCTDGDPACDEDGMADGACRFTVRLCTGMATPGCDPVPLSEIVTSGLELEPPPLPDEAGSCGATRTIRVAVGAAEATTVLARGGGELRDVDYLNLCCEGEGGSPLGAVRCALRADLTASGCAVPRRAVRAMQAAARQLASDTPSGAALRRARRKLGIVRSLAKALATRQPCANALGLMARHAQDVLAAAARRK